uniref:RCC1-like domain-containing protein n=1 Tax=Cyprinodon variegatus TaxID=28743 RepID=A0A3Q2FPX5_CYPVA
MILTHKRKSLIVSPGDLSSECQVYTWGLDSRGQLGLGKRGSGARSPQQVRSLSSVPVVQISAGGDHSFALSVSGGVFGWGRNNCGQLGLGGTKDVFTPTCVSSLNLKKTSDICCGKDHTAVLTKVRHQSGGVYTWGEDSRGQLGLGTGNSGSGSPQHVQTLSAIPVVLISAGAEHSFALSVSGGVFGWGGNDCGQLGLGDSEGDNFILNRNTPTSVSYLNMKKVVHISCGKEHTVVLTKDGVVFTFGSGKYGQLGHNSFQNELRPRLVAELWGAKVTKTACGRYFTSCSCFNSNQYCSFNNLKS